MTYSTDEVREIIFETVDRCVEQGFQNGWNSCIENIIKTCVRHPDWDVYDLCSALKCEQEMEGRM